MEVTQVIAAFVGVCCYGFSTETPKRFITYAGIGGAFCWLVYMRADVYSQSVVIASFCGALFVGAYSHIMARVLKTPVTLFLLGGILPLVPGGQIYKTVYYLMKQDTQTSSDNFILTLKIAGVIALAIFLVDTVFILWKRKSEYR